METQQVTTKELECSKVTVRANGDHIGTIIYFKTGFGMNVFFN